MSHDEAHLGTDQSVALGPARRSHPRHFITSAYEADKHRATLASLPKLRYRRGLEVGCSTGVLTERLVWRCHSLLAVDMVELAPD